MLLMKVSAIIIEIIVLIAPYDPITTTSIPGKLANWRYDA